jgi:hypothetical protein
MYSSVSNFLRGLFSKELFWWVNRLEPRKKVAISVRMKEIFVFLIEEWNIQAQMRQKIMQAIPITKEGERKDEKRMPPARLRARKKKGKSMLHTIDGGPPQCVSDARGSRTKDDT